MCVTKEFSSHTHNNNNYNKNAMSNWRIISGENINNTHARRGEAGHVRDMVN